MESEKTNPISSRHRPTQLLTPQRLTLRPGDLGGQISEANFGGGAVEMRQNVLKIYPVDVDCPILLNVS